MRITFYGTSNANPHPGRGQTCIHIEAAGLDHVVDCGDGATTKLWLDPARDWSRLRALLISHLHPDHAAGMFFLLHLLHQRAKDNPAWDIHSADAFRLCVPQGNGARKLTGCLSALHVGRETLAYNLNYEFYTTGVPFEAGAMKVTPLPTSHCEDAHSFSMEAEGLRVVFSGDLGDPDDIAEHAPGADLVICECAHFHPTQLVPVLLELRAKHYVLTHLHDQLLRNPDETDELFQPLEQAGALTFAHDGLVIDV